MQSAMFSLLGSFYINNTDRGVRIWAPFAPKPLGSPRGVKVGWEPIKIEFSGKRFSRDNSIWRVWIWAPLTPNHIGRAVANRNRAFCFLEGRVIYTWKFVCLSVYLSIYRCSELASSERMFTWRWTLLEWIFIHSSQEVRANQLSHRRTLTAIYAHNRGKSMRGKLSEKMNKKRKILRVKRKRKTPYRVKERKDKEKSIEYDAQEREQDMNEQKKKMWCVPMIDTL